MDQTEWFPGQRVVHPLLGAGTVSWADPPKHAAVRFDSGRYVLALLERLNETSSMKWQSYRKRPVVIQARGPIDAVETIETLEGVMTASVGDYVICGVSGEMYPCKPDIFARTYEPAEGC